MASLDKLATLLRKSARLLDEAAKEIRAADLRPQANVLKIAEALQRISDVQFEIYKRQPGLVPPHLENTVTFAKRGKAQAGRRQRRPPTTS